MTYIVYQYPGYGWYPENAQYINVPHAVHRTSVTARGTNIPNESFEYPLGSGSYIASYSAWCAALAAAGTKLLRVIWGGRHMSASPSFYDLEPPPAGTYNVWHSALDDGNLTTFRAHQVSGSPGDESFPSAYWTGSNIKEFFDACEANGLKVIVELSHNKEWSGSEWTYHPWNYNNHYRLSGDACAAQDKGFLSEPTEVFTNPDALQAMKDRISFVINLLQEYRSIVMWGICSEGNWLFVPAFWPDCDTFNATLIAHIRDDITPWYAAVAKHIRDEDPRNRPIMSSAAQSPPDGVWSADPDQYRNVMIEPLMTYPIDVIGTNCYQGNFKLMVQHLNAMREKVHPKQILIHQYYPEPWVLGPTAPLRQEYEPYVNSKRCEWLGAVLKWSTGPGRWMGLEELTQHNVWTQGGYADPNWYSLGAVTAAFRAANNWKDWSGAQDWADYVSSTGLDYSLTTGDGNHFAGLLVWTSGGEKTLTISNVTDGDWTFKIYDWPTGSLDATETPTASSNSLSLSVTPSTYYQAVVLGSKD